MLHFVLQFNTNIIKSKMKYACKWMFGMSIYLKLLKTYQIVFLFLLLNNMPKKLTWKRLLLKLVLN